MMSIPVGVVCLFVEKKYVVTLLAVFMLLVTYLTERY